MFNIFLFVYKNLIFCEGVVIYFKIGFVNGKNFIFIVDNGRFYGEWRDMVVVWVNIESLLLIKIFFCLLLKKIS